MIQSFFGDLRREKEYREKRDLPIRTIAQETGLSQGAILRVKNMTMERVSLTTLETLCRYFRVTSLCQLVDHMPDERDTPGD
jgi:transcriptional regulator with XRE-family HTH domain